MKRAAFFAIVSYVLLTILMTWPTIIQMTIAIPGDGFDGWQNYWNLWWIKEALLVRQTHFFFTDILYPPSGTSLLFHTLNFFNGLFSLPLQLNLGLAATYNSLVFFHFILAGFGIYLLARYVLQRVERLSSWSPWQSWWAAFAAGSIFTFAPFHFAHLLGHMQVFSLTWPPFYILWLLRTTNEWRLKSHPGKRQKPTAKDLALMGIFLAFATMIDWYQTLYMLICTALVIGWRLWVGWRDQSISLKAIAQLFLGLGGLSIMFGLLFSPLILPMMIEATTASYMRPSFAENVILSADLLAFFTPSELHPLWGKAVLPLYQTFTTTTSERLVFAGFVPLILAIYAVYRYHRQRLVQFWLGFTLIFFTLALGPYLHIAGKIIQVGQTPLPLPYLFLYKVIPFIGISRSLSRFDLMVMVGLGVLAAVGLLRFKPISQALITGLIYVEFLAIPFPMSFIDTPAFFQQIAADDETYTLAALPMNWDRPSPLLYQTVHGKNLLTAYTSRQNPLDLSWRTPVLQQWRTLQADIIDADLALIAPTVLHDFRIKYVVLDYYQMPPGPEREATEKWVAAALPHLSPSYDDERLKVYPAPAVAELRSYLQLGPNWGSLERQDDIPIRVMPDTAHLKLVNTHGQTITLRIETIPPHNLQDLAVFSEQRSLPTQVEPDGFTASLVVPPNVETIRLQTSDPRPISRLHLIVP